MTLKETINDLHKYRNIVFVLFVFCMMTTFSFFATRGMQRSSAAAVQGFNPGNIINDAVMSDYNSMTKDEIQAFLTSKNSCNNRSYDQYIYLKGRYPHLDWHFEDGHFICLSEERFGDGTTIGEGQTAAEIIYDAAQDYQINPRVLIVLLEKEQSLITDDYPNSTQYRSATGYGCPDTAACNTKYYGFKNQVRNAAALFRDVLDRGYSRYPENRSGVYVQFSPNASCGSSEVYIENRATAALYRYTPYQPNTAALNAGYGQGDACSAYGNRNFYLYFTDWFGSTQVATSPSQNTNTSQIKEINLPDGTYTFVSQLSDQVILGAANQNSQLTSFTNGYTWRIEQDSSTGLYRLIDKNNHVLQSASTAVTLGTNVLMGNNTSTCSALWRIFYAPDGTLMFESGCESGYFLDVSGGINSIGTNIQLWERNNSISQKWTIYTGPVLPDGKYILTTERTNDRAVDISGGNDSNGTNIQLWESNSSISQEWNLKYDQKTDLYTLTNPMSGRSLDVSGGNIASGTNIQLWESNSTCSQTWKIIANQSGSYTLLSACSPQYALDLSGSGTSNGTNIQLWESNNTISQRWQIAAPDYLENGIYTIGALDDKNKVIDISYGLFFNGTNIQLWENNNTISQEWRLTYNAGTKDYSIINTASGKALDISGGWLANGANIQLWENNNTCAQRWQIRQTADGYYNLLSACSSNFALDLNSAETWNGNNVGLWSTTGGATQKWRLTKK